MTLRYKTKHDIIEPKTPIIQQKKANMTVNLEKKIRQQGAKIQIGNTQAFLCFPNAFEKLSKKKKKECQFGYKIEMKVRLYRLLVTITKTQGPSLNKIDVFSKQLKIVNELVLEFLFHTILAKKNVTYMSFDIHTSNGIKLTFLKEKPPFFGKDEVKHYFQIICDTTPKSSRIKGFSLEVGCKDNINVSEFTVPRKNKDPNKMTLYLGVLNDKPNGANTPPISE